MTPALLREAGGPRYQGDGLLGTVKRLGRLARSPSGAHPFHHVTKVAQSPSGML